MLLEKASKLHNVWNSFGILEAYIFLTMLLLECSDTIKFYFWNPLFKLKWNNCKIEALIHRNNLEWIIGNDIKSHWTIKQKEQNCFYCLTQKTVPQCNHKFSIFLKYLQLHIPHVPCPKRNKYLRYCLGSRAKECSCRIELSAACFKYAGIISSVDSIFANFQSHAISLFWPDQTRVEIMY